MRASAVAYIAAATFVGSTAVGHAAELESAYQKRLYIGMLINRHLPNGTEVDCISDTHAIEVDFTNKWAEAIGQSLQYASALRRLPGIILICRSESDPSLCLKHRYLIEQTMSYWRVGMTLWLCEGDAMTLADCRREEICGPDKDSICDTTQ